VATRASHTKDLRLEADSPKDIFVPSVIRAPEVCRDNCGVSDSVFTPTQNFATKANA
jgi:hypothetical protein